MSAPSVCSGSQGSFFRGASVSHGNSGASCNQRKQGRRGWEQRLIKGEIDERNGTLVWPVCSSVSSVVDPRHPKYSGRKLKQELDFVVPSSRVVI